MGVTTKIEWCDSTLNLEAGCDGCELWTPTRKTCYAGQLTERWGGKPGWPRIFTEPVTFPHRIEQLEKWSDLTGTNRPEKPWLNGKPRMVFLNDMGDTFTESLPLNWMEPLLPRLEALPHIIMILTKRGNRMREFFTAVGVPKNFWLYVSVTKRGQHQRVWDLLEIPGGFIRGLSLEPQEEDIDLDEHELLCRTWRQGLTIGRYLDHVIQGGGSGHGAELFNLSWARKTRDQCAAAGTSYFLKQLGARIAGDRKEFGPYSVAWTEEDGTFGLNDRKGGDMESWPEGLRIREFPEVLHA